MSFINDDFLLTTKTARRLYHQFAEEQPILDYHCHLLPKDIAENRPFKSLFEIMLEGDHYKWRAMRANGVGEKYCTGDASPYDKFCAFAATLPHALRNPLYHWTHLELKRYFGIDELLSEASAQRIWEAGNKLLATPELTTHGILKKFRVTALCTTDDPTDDLRCHKAIAQSGLATRVYPTFRPDNALAVHQPEQFNHWVAHLAEASNVDIGSLSALLDALRRRIDYFHAHNCRLADHGLDQACADFCSAKVAADIFEQTRRGRPATPQTQRQFASSVMLFVGRLYAERGWTMQLHLGALRNNNTRLPAATWP